MNTKKQVLDAFARLQKKYLDITGFVVVRAYKQSDKRDSYWSVEIVVSAFESGKLIWQENADWVHYNGQNEEDEERNVAAVEEFVKRMDARMSNNK